jgi:uncharacterized protein YjiK
MKIGFKIFGLLLVGLSFITLQSCENDEPTLTPTNPEGKLEKLNQIQLSIPEPSGLSFGPTNNTLLVVSDHTNLVYETDLTGKIIRTLNYTGQDLEGVTYNLKTNIVAVVEERKREVILIDYTNGNELSRYKIEVEESSDNKGLEGIGYSSNNSAYYIVNEALPGQMIIWNPQSDIISKTDLNFANDYSAIYIETENSKIWMVSDESQGLYECNYNAEVLREFTLPTTKFEGLVIDSKNRLAYLVHDGTGELTIFKIVD